MPLPSWNPPRQIAFTVKAIKCINHQDKKDTLDGNGTEKKKIKMKKLKK
jgi:hypothetical protein